VIPPRAPRRSPVSKGPSSARSRRKLTIAPISPPRPARAWSKCEVIQELAFPSDPYSVATTKAIEAKVPNAKIVQKIVGQYDPSTVAKAFPDALSAHPDADIFVASSDQTALAVLPALKQAGKTAQVKLLGAGGSRQGTKAVKDGTLFGTIGNWPEQSTEAIGKMMIQSVNGKPVSPNSIDMFTIDKPAVVTKDNIAQFTPEWGPAAP
jgi:ABC-type sugar transport system substrate-binding protein